MVFSLFNIYNEHNDKTIIFNTLTGALACIDKKNLVVNDPQLIYNGFVVNEKEDLNIYKYLYLSRLFDDKNIHLSIATTMSCNLRCPYCFEEGNKSLEFMSDIVADAIVKYLVAKKKHNIHITWFGGEPLLNLKVIERISTALMTNRIKFTSSVITNGTVLNESIVKRLAKYSVSSIQITFDGTKKLHDKKRFFPNRKGTFDLILSNIGKVLRFSEINLILKINLDKSNIESYESLVKELKHQFGEYVDSRRIQIDRNYIRNRNNFKGCENCLSEESYFERFYDKGYALNYISNHAGPCPFRSRADFAIGPDGSIYKCLELLGNKSKSIGNILHQKISVNQQAGCALSYSPFDDKKCLRCPVLPICGGGCPIDREKVYNGKLQSVCPIIKDKIQKIILDIYEMQYAKE